MRRLAAILVCALVSLAIVAVAPGAEARVQQGVVQWRFQVSGQYVLHPPAVGPDGGVVVASSTGNVYSLTPAGALRWVVPSVGGSGGPSIGPDGTVYVASMGTVTAIAPERLHQVERSPSPRRPGRDRRADRRSGWEHLCDLRLGGLGAFALSPAGQLLWSNPGNPTFAENGQLGAEIVFGSGRLYAAFDERSIALSTMFGLSLGGAQHWATSARWLRRPVHAAAAPAGDRAGRQPLPDRDGRRERLEPVPRRPGQRQRALELLPLPIERDVGSQCRAGWVGLLLEEPGLPRVGDPCRSVALDVLRRLDHRSPRGQPRRQRRRRRRSSELRPARFRPGVERGDGTVAWQIDLPK